MHTHNTQYPAAETARQMYGDSYGDYIQQHLDNLAARGINRAGESLGSLLMGNDGE